MDVFSLMYFISQEKRKFLSKGKQKRKLIENPDLSAASVVLKLRSCFFHLWLENFSSSVLQVFSVLLKEFSLDS